MTRRIYLSPPDARGRERELLLDAFDSNWIAPLGPYVDRFEEVLGLATGRSHVAALSSGTAALHLALRMLGVGRGDRVYVSTFTFCGSVNPILYEGAEPVFVDSDASWTMDPALLEEALSADDRRGTLPKAVVAVDLYGQIADYDRIAAVCARFGVPLIEDAAEALGATDRARKAGSFGDFAILSFNGNKIITTSGGGALACSKKEQADRARFLSTQARDPAPHYEHTEIGFNYRLSNLLAAVGCGQLETLADRVARRRALFEAYVRDLGDLEGLEFMPEREGTVHTRWLTTLTLDPERAKCTREDVRLRLAELDIESRPVWKPMHLQPVYRSFRCVGGAVSERIFERGLCLPSGSSLLDEEQALVARTVRSVRGA
jgi:dTDP-4-amino-4,6-dideoxygalactose transaminase